MRLSLFDCCCIATIKKWKLFKKKINAITHIKSGPKHVQYKEYAKSNEPHFFFFTNSFNPVVPSELVITMVQCSKNVFFLQITLQLLQKSEEQNIQALLQIYLRHYKRRTFILLMFAQETYLFLFTLKIYKFWLMKFLRTQKASFQKYLLIS